MNESLSTRYKLSDGYEIPCVGFGTYLSENGQECYDAVRTAIKTGYRHIDTASFYRNEDSVGQAIRDCGLAREKLFVTTKLWNDDQGYDNTLRAFEKSYTALGLDYFDLYLIHWPIPQGREHDYRELNEGTWRAFIELREQGLVHSIGVSNFLPEHIDYLVARTNVPPVVDQIEAHPGLPQRELAQYCKANGILVEAWRPLMKGDASKSPELIRIAEKHGVTPSQVALRWALQIGYIPLPKSVTPSRIKENADIFGFTLDDEDMAIIAGIQEKRYGYHPLSFGKR